MIKPVKVKKTRQWVSFLAMTKASILMSLRNPTSLFFNFFFPFIFITIFGLLNFSNASFDVYLRSDSLKEGVVYEALNGVEALKLHDDISDADIDDGLSKGSVAVALDIQEDQVITMAPGMDVTTYKVDMETSAGAPEAAGSIVSIIGAVNSQINASLYQDQLQLVTESQELVEGRKYQQIDFVLPGQLAFALLSNALFGIAFTFMVFKRNLILKRYFATPIRKFNILGSEVMSKTLIAILQAVVIIGVGYFLFDFTLAHGWLTFLNMMILSLIGILVFLSFGLFIVSVAKNEDGITPLAQLIMMPQLFLSGAFFPIESFPDVVQPVAKVLPMTLLNESFKMVAFEGMPLMDTLPYMGGLLLWGVVMYILVLILFKWE